MPRSSAHFLCLAAIATSTVICTWQLTAQSPEKEPLPSEEMIKRDDVEAGARASGAIVIPDMTMTVVVLPLEYLNSDLHDSDKTVRRLLRRHPTAPSEVKFWQPDAAKARAAFAKVMEQAKNEPYKRLEKPQTFACQVFGLESGNQKLVVCNFVMERRREHGGFCITPDDFHDLRWPYGGTVILDEKNNIVSRSQRLETDQQ